MTKYAIFASALVLAAGSAFAEQQSERQSGWENEQSASAQSQNIPAPVSDPMIRQLQQALNEHGQNLRTDGIWGPETHQALRQYQQEQGLEANGQINTDTLASLNLEEQQTAELEQGQQAQDQQAAMGQDQQASLGQDQQTGMGEDQQASADQDQDQQASWEQPGVDEEMEEELSAAYGEGEPAEEASAVMEDPREDEGSIQATAPADNLEEEAEQSLEQAETELEEGQQELEQQG